MNSIKTALAFLSALISGSASFFITLGGKKYAVSLTNNGTPTAPNLGVIAQLTSNLILLTATGAGTATVRAGTNNWTVTATVVAA